MSCCVARRVLIITSAVPPVMLADMHRARMLCHELLHCGWNVEVLVPDVAFYPPVYLDFESAPLWTGAVPLHSAPISSNHILSVLGVRSVGWRGLWPMYRVGCRVLRQRHFDLVYFSTTQFNLFCLGRLWQRRFGVPYVLDFHDPWVRETIKYATTRHRVKAAISTCLSSHLERYALRHAAGLVSVSPRYLDELSRRYPRFVCTLPGRRQVIPFGATPRDFDVSGAAEPVNHRTSDGTALEVAYVGAGGCIMVKSFRVIAKTLGRLRTSRPDLVSRVRIRLFGTDPFRKQGEPKELEFIAQQHGVGDLVSEQPTRIGYLAATRQILEANGALILGVDDDGYMPSKLFSYALSGKPLLASLHRASPAYDCFRRNPELGHAIWFDDSHEMPLEEAATVVSQFLHEAEARRTFDRLSLLEPYLAPAMARRHVELFEACLG